MSQLPQLGSTLPDELLFVSTTAAATAAANATEPEYSTPVMGLLGFLASVASFVTVVGNLLVITAFFVERQLRSATNYFIASLAITDLLIGMFSMNLYTLYLLLGKWPLGRFVCNMWLSLDYTACLTSQYTVFCITVDRFCSVKIPAKYRKWRTERKVQLMVAATWVLPAMLFVPSTFAWPYLSSKVRSEDACYAEFSEDPVYNTVLTICYFWVTLVAMIALYIGIYRVALNLARKSEAKRQKVSNLITMANQTARSVTRSWRRRRRRRRGGGGGGRGSGSAGGGEAGKSPQRPLIKAAGGGGGGGDVTAGRAEQQPAPPQKPQPAVGDDEIEVIQCGAEERRKQLHLPTLAQSFRDATRRLRSRVRTKRQDRQKKKQSRTENRARKALKTITLILGAFVVCWTPYHIFILIRSICQAQCLNKHLFNLGYWLCYLNSPINPFCYALANAQFKKAFLRIIRLDLRRR
uniref:G_PROTEIN_RECEP_F1_2 domain-containing protein n=1 Tax=Macrostomum lignano TaxID=282301 RepID=A0A1I8IZF1_9PLAT